MRPVHIAAVALLLLPACTDKHKDPNAALAAARARLAQLATATANGTYDATYGFAQAEGSASGNIRIRQRPPQIRIDIITKDTASYYSLAAGTVSCSQKGFKKACFLVARPGEEVPALFDPGVQRLFRDAVDELAANPDDYTVTRVLPTESPSPTEPASTSPTGSPSATPLPVGECYLVSRLTTPAPDQPSGFENGTYCFAEEGIPTRIDVQSGTLTLSRIGPLPTDATFKPIAKVQKLPELSPAPSKK